MGRDIVVERVSLKVKFLKGMPCLQDRLFYVTKTLTEVLNIVRSLARTDVKVSGLTIKEEDREWILYN